MKPFDAVLLIAFGGPQGPEDIRPFLANVLRGRRVAPGRLEEVAHHYELFGGVSPLTALTMRQAEGLAARLRDDGPLPVYVGMRNWHPYLKDTLARMAADGVRHAVGVIAAAHRSYSSCLQYKENVADAQAALAGEGVATPDVTYISDWYMDSRFIDANASHVLEALARLPEGLRNRAQLVFTAHSIPESMAARYPYRAQFEETVRLVADRVNAARGGASLAVATVYQSRSGRPEDPWLGPDVCDYLRQARTEGAEAAVLCPIGFIVDHVEVLYDLDTEAADVAREIGLPIERASTVNDDPRFLDALADAVRDTVRRYSSGAPLRVIAPVQSLHS